MPTHSLDAPSAKIWRERLQRLRRSARPALTQQQVADRIGTVNSEVSRFENGDPATLRRWFEDPRGSGHAKRYAQELGLTLQGLRELLREISGQAAQDAPWHPAFPQLSADAVWVPPPCRMKQEQVYVACDWQTAITSIEKPGPVKLGGEPGSGRDSALQRLRAALPGVQVDLAPWDEAQLRLQPWGRTQLDTLIDQLVDHSPSVAAAVPRLRAAAEQVQALGILMGPDLAIRLVAALARAEDTQPDLYRVLPELLLAGLAHPSLRALDAHFLPTLWADIRTARGGGDWCVLSRQELVDATGRALQRWAGALTNADTILDDLDHLSDADLRKTLTALRQRRAAVDPPALAQALVDAGHFHDDGPWLQPQDWSAAELLAGVGLSVRLESVVADPHWCWALDASWWPVLRIAVSSGAPVAPWVATWTEVPGDLAGPVSLALVHVLLGARPGADMPSDPVLSEIQAVAALSVHQLSEHPQSRLLSMLRPEDTLRAVARFSHRFRDHLKPLTGDLVAGLRERLPARLSAATPTVEARSLPQLLRWQVLSRTTRDDEILTWWAERGHQGALASLSGPASGDQAAWAWLDPTVQIRWLGAVEPEQNLPAALPGLVSALRHQPELGASLLERLRELPPEAVRQALDRALEPALNGLSWAQRAWLIKAAVMAGHPELLDAIARCRAPQDDLSGPGRTLFTSALADQRVGHGTSHLQSVGLAPSAAGVLDRIAQQVALDRARHRLGQPQALRARQAPDAQPQGGPSAEGLLRWGLEHPPEPPGLPALLHTLPASDALEAALNAWRQGWTQWRIEAGEPADRARTQAAERYPAVDPDSRWSWVPGTRWQRELADLARDLPELWEGPRGHQLRLGMAVLDRATTERLPAQLPEAVRTWLHDLARTAALQRAFRDLLAWAHSRLVIDACLAVGALRDLDEERCRVQADTWLRGEPSRADDTWRDTTAPRWIQALALQVALERDPAPGWATSTRDRRTAHMLDRHFEALQELPAAPACARVLRQLRFGDLAPDPRADDLLRRWWPEPDQLPPVSTGWPERTDPSLDHLVDYLAARDRTWRPWVRGLLATLWQVPLGPADHRGDGPLNHLPATVYPPTLLFKIVDLALDKLSPGELLEIWQADDPTPSDCTRQSLNHLHPFLDPVERTGPVSAGQLRRLWLWKLGADRVDRLPPALHRSDTPLLQAAARAFRAEHRRLGPDDRAWLQAALGHWRDAARPADDPTLELWELWALPEPIAAWAWLQEVVAERPELTVPLRERCRRAIELLRSAAPAAVPWVWTEG